MHIPTYQIYNILNIYTKWVSRNETSSMEKFNGDESSFDRPSIPADRYRKSIMQKVSGNIVSKITCLELNDKRSQKIAEKLKGYESKNGRLEEKNGDKFVYNSIDEGSKKVTNVLLIDKSSLLTKQTK